jgi:hypothetical protein
VESALHGTRADRPRELFSVWQSVVAYCTDDGNSGNLQVHFAVEAVNMRPNGAPWRAGCHVCEVMGWIEVQVEVREL